MSRARVLAALLLAASCTNFDTLEADTLCAQFQRCDGGGGQGDAGEADAGVDAGALDAGTDDAGLDAGEPADGGGDAGPVDAGAPDAGAPDGGRDGGLDGGLDGGGLDAAVLDAGPPVRQLDLRVAWYRTHTVPGATELPGYVTTSTDGGRVMLFSNSMSPNGALFGGVYEVETTGGGWVLDDGGLSAAGSVYPVPNAARAYTQGRISGATAQAGSFFISFEPVLLDGGPDPASGNGDFIRGYPVDTFPFPIAQPTAVSLTDRVPSVLLRLVETPASSRWYVLGGLRSAPGTVEAFGGVPQAPFTSTSVLVALGCAVPSQAASGLGSTFALSRCPDGGTKHLSLFSGLSVNVFDGPSAGPNPPVLAQAPDALSPPLMAWADPLTNNVFVQVQEAMPSPPRLVATTSSGFELVSMAIDAQRRPYLLGRLAKSSTTRGSLTPAGASFVFNDRTPWIVLGLTPTLEVRWAGGVTVPHGFESNSLAVAAGRVFMEARCAPTMLVAPEDGGFCMAGVSNLVVRLEAADGGAL